jgi:hypothetical protein
MGFNSEFKSVKRSVIWPVVPEVCEGSEQNKIIIQIIIIINFVLMTQCVLLRTAFRYYLNEVRGVKEFNVIIIAIISSYHNQS